MPKSVRRKTRREKFESNDDYAPKYQKSVHIEPQTERQQTFLNACENSEVVFATGCAGTGKTYIALAYAARAYLRREVRKIILTRPIVPAGGRDIGYVPGDESEKLERWVRPNIAILEQILGKPKVKAMLGTGEITVGVFATMRGETFDDAVVVLDEAQNATTDELKMFLTRIGKHSTTILTGDTEQTDLTSSSGLHVVVRMVQNQGLPFPVIAFQEDDIVRSEVCRTFIRAFRRERI